MNPHIPDDLLQDFVFGEVGEQVATHIAEHLDECPQCLNHAAGIEPLSVVFALLDDPIPPPDLADAVLAEFRVGERTPITEVLVAMALLGSATGVAGILGSPLAFTKDFAVALSALSDVVRVVSVSLSHSSITMTLLMAVALGGLAVSVRLSETDFNALMGTRRLL